MSFCPNGHVQELETIKYVMHYVMNFYEFNLMYKGVTNLFVIIKIIHFVYRSSILMVVTPGSIIYF